MNTVIITGGIAAVFLVLAHLRNVANSNASASDSGPVAPTYAQQLPDFGTDGSGSNSFQATPFDALGMLQQLQSAYPQPILNLTPDLSVVDNPPTSAPTRGTFTPNNVKGFLQRAGLLARPVSSPGASAAPSPSGTGFSRGGVTARPVATPGSPSFGSIPAAPTTSANFNPTRGFNPTTGLKRPVGGRP